MRSNSVAAILAALCIVSSASAADFVIDDFDGGEDGIVLSRTISPVPGTMLAGGDMFEPGNRADVLANFSFGLPFSISDDSLEGAALNGAFEFDSQGLFGVQKTDSFFGVADITNDQNPAVAPATVASATVDWEINTTGLSNMMLTVDVGAMGDFELDDVFRFEVSFDGGANFTPVMVFGVNEDIEHTYRPLDDQHRTSFADFDDSTEVDATDLATWATNYGAVGQMDNTTGDADGNEAVDGPDFIIWQQDLGPARVDSVTTLNDPMVFLGADMVLGGGDDVILDKTDRDTGELDSVSAAISGSGSSMILRFYAAQDSGSEAFGFDNVILTADVAAVGAVPEPTTLALVVLGLGSVWAARRRG
ncbi:MAG: hypothetical protein CMJ58_28255 [Planctomycetaceae bacterium]|nr:hypothetical protein [Planctomycetaceae bacterium]